MLLDKGANVNSDVKYLYIGIRGPTRLFYRGAALCATSAEGYKEVVQMLLDSGVNINAESPVYGTAL